jgi:hypothetical protein
MPHRQRLRQLHQPAIRQQLIRRHSSLPRSSNSSRPEARLRLSNQHHSRLRIPLRRSNPRLQRLRHQPHSKQQRPFESLAGEIKLRAVPEAAFLP